MLQFRAQVCTFTMPPPSNNSRFPAAAPRPQSLRSLHIKQSHDSSAHTALTELHRASRKFEARLTDCEDDPLAQKENFASELNYFYSARHLSGITDQWDFNPNHWPDLDVQGLDSKKLETYLKRKLGIQLFFTGASTEEIKKQSGLSVTWINRIIRIRCMKTHPDGMIYGWRALVRYSRIAEYERKKKIKADAFGRGCAGAMGALLLSEPDFAQRFERWILKTVAPGKIGEINKPLHTAWRWFLDELSKLGYEIRNEWPFTTASRGYQAVRNHVNRIKAANPRSAALLLGGKPLADKLQAGDGVDRPVRRAFQRVEMDAHKLNGRFCILVPHPLGGHVPTIIKRLWIIVIIDVVSRAVLGYYLSRRAEVNKQDVLLAIRSALTCWQRLSLSMGDVDYMDEGALPSGHNERYVGLCWDETSVDGALAGTCSDVVSTLRAVVGSTIVEPSKGWSQRRLKDDRPFVETFFRTLGQRGLNRLSNSTGSKPSEKVGRDPELVALNSQFQLEYLEELLDVLIANYNATEHAGLGHRSPLQFLDFLMTRADSSNLRRADPQLVSGLLSVRKMCTVKGGYREGRRPYINFYGARYSGEVFADRHDLVGKKITITNHLHDDARVVKASTEDGYSLGILRAARPWHDLPHSISVRSAINTLVNARKLRIAAGGDAVAAFIKYVESSPGKKLLPHPAYLALRRILADADQQAENRDVGRDVDMARARLTELDNVIAKADGFDCQATPSTASAKEVASPYSAPAQSIAQAKPASARTIEPKKKLPMPRMTACR